MKTIWDTEVKGLHIRTSLTGKRSAFLYYRTKQGRQRRPKIGDLDIEITFGEARKIAKSWWKIIADGGDPSLKNQIARSELSVSELFSLTIEAHWSQQRFIDSGWKYEVERLYQARIAPALGNHKLSEVTVAVAKAWHQSFAGNPYEGNRALSVLSRMFSHAEDAELRPQNTNPCKPVKYHDEKKRERFATVQEIQEINLVMEREAYAHTREVAFLYLLMFTGSRPSAIERATWADLERVDYGGHTVGILTLKGKTGEEKIVIPPQGMEVLMSLPQPADSSCTLTGIKMPRKFWNRIRKEVGCNDLWARDWRRTFATIGINNKIPMAEISKLLNHKKAATTEIYAKLQDHTKLAAALQIASQLETIIVGGK